MSYHDSYMGAKAATDKIVTNTGTVHPLVAIEEKLTQIKKLLSSPDQIQELSAIELKNRIEQILNE